MTKQIGTIVEDIYAVIEGRGGWSSTLSAATSEGVSILLDQRLGEREERQRGTLRMSNLGTPCARSLWYKINEPDGGEDLRGATLLKFLYGDLLEQLLISLAIASGHEVLGCQDTVSISGIIGHRDCVIDGMVVDIKSASSRAFAKFKEHKLESDDPFGYLSQLSSYVYAAKDDPLVTNKTHGAFLAINKENGEIVLDVYDLSSFISRKEEEVEHLKRMVASPVPPDRSFDAVPDGKSGNMKLSTNCSYCDRKFKCWPEVRTFIYSTGPRYLTRVAREPDVPEKYN